MTISAAVLGALHALLQWFGDHPTPVTVNLARDAHHVVRASVVRGSSDPRDRTTQAPAGVSETASVVRGSSDPRDLRVAVVNGLSSFASVVRGSSDPRDDQRRLAALEVDVASVVRGSSDPRDVGSHRRIGGPSRCFSGSGIIRPP